MPDKMSKVLCDHVIFTFQISIFMSLLFVDLNNYLISSIKTLNPDLSSFLKQPQKSSCMPGPIIMKHILIISWFIQVPKYAEFQSQL